MSTKKQLARQNWCDPAWEELDAIWGRLFAIAGTMGNMRLPDNDPTLTEAECAARAENAVLHEGLSAVVKVLETRYGKSCFWLRRMEIDRACGTRPEVVAAAEKRAREAREIEKRRRTIGGVQDMLRGTHLHDLPPPSTNGTPFW